MLRSVPTPAWQAATRVRGVLNCPPPVRGVHFAGRNVDGLKRVCQDQSEWTCLGRVKFPSKPSIPFPVFSVFPITWGICSSLDRQPQLPFQLSVVHTLCKGGLYPWP